MNVVVVFLGGGIGAVARNWMQGAVYRIAGATVLRGVEGFGARSRIHTAKILRLSEDRPIVVEIVDSEEKVKAFLSAVDKMFEGSGSGGMMTLERAEVIRYTHGAT